MRRDRKVICAACFSRFESVSDAGLCLRCEREVGTLVADQAERTRPASDGGSRVRHAVVAFLKAAKGRHRGMTDLTPTELDAVFPPVDCARTRDRIGTGVVHG